VTPELSPMLASVPYVTSKTNSVWAGHDGLKCIPGIPSYRICLWSEPRFEQNRQGRHRLDAGNWPSLSTTPVSVAVCAKPQDPHAQRRGHTMGGLASGLERPATGAESGYPSDSSSASAWDCNSTSSSARRLSSPATSASGPRASSTSFIA
jgi:hypothetical protein